MKLSTRSRYGLRAMMVLGMHKSDEPIMTKEIAEKQNLPATYLEQLMLALRKAGLVNATRGAKGGYVLSKQPDEISLVEIVEALEGPIDIADCADVPNCCIDATQCALKIIFEEANNALYSVFEKKNLAQLVKIQQSMEGNQSQMYYI
ncbi:MAG: Rrf2 family transcriptional regulator [Armatimonadota bacterium]